MGVKTAIHAFVILLVSVVVSCLLVALMPPSTAMGDTVDTRPGTSYQQTRACAFGGAGVEVDCSAAVAYSAQLLPNTRYAMQAVGGNVYWRQTLRASGEDCDTSADLYIPQGGIAEMSTVNGRRYISCDGSGATATLRYVECQ